jgi:hypothetical protein
MFCASPGRVAGDAGIVADCGCWLLGGLPLEADMMDSSEGRKRVLELAWKNYDEVVVTRRRLADRVAIVLGASVAGVGVMFKDIDFADVTSTLGRLALSAMFASIVGAFVCAGVVSAPRECVIPSSTDPNRLWHFLVTAGDDAGAANLLGDICVATNAEGQLSRRLSRWLVGCIALSAVAVVASMAVKMLSIR